MGIWKRLMALFAAEVHHQIDEAEDPEAMILQMVRVMEQSVREATASTGAAVANEKHLERQVADRKAQIKEWQRKAEKALEKEKETLARSALERIPPLDRAVAELKKVLAESRKTSEHLKTQLVRLKTKLDNARTEQATLVARCRAAESRQHIAQAISEIGDDAFSSFEKFRTRIEAEESTAQIQEEISGAETEDVFARMADEDAVEQKLAALKEKKA